MFFGRQEPGQPLSLKILCQDLDGKPILPDLPPAVYVYNASGAKVLSAQMAPVDKFRTTGLFHYQLFLDGRFPAGRYGVLLAWRQSGNGWVRVGHFEVLPGGDPAGSVVSLYWLERPHARTLVGRTDGGMHVLGRNPSL